MSAGLQLADYLERLPGTTFRRLYQQPSTAFAIFRRMLPHMGKGAHSFFPSQVLCLGEGGVWLTADGGMQLRRS